MMLQIGVVDRCIIVVRPIAGVAGDDDSMRLLIHPHLHSPDNALRTSFCKIIYGTRRAPGPLGGQGLMLEC